MKSLGSTLSSKNLSQFQVFHLPKISGIAAFSAAPVLEKVSAIWPGSFLLETCQRWVWVNASEKAFEAPDPIEHLSGAQAYAFLLRVTTGLESVIAGEADVFGQFKQAWAQVSRSAQADRDLAFWMQRLFEDTKEIRTHYLQNLGVSSYGSLVRKLVNERFPKQPRQILLLGSGLLAQSIAPYFLEENPAARSDEVWVWNRSASGLEVFKSALPEKLISRSELNFMPVGAPGLQAFGNLPRITPRIVIYCIPSQAAAAEESLQHFSSADLLLHLGGCRGDFQTELRDYAKFMALDDLFKNQHERSEIRLQKLKRARMACEERAQLRSLGHSLSIAHGWEDLAGFALASGRR